MAAVQPRRSKVLRVAPVSAPATQGIARITLAPAAGVDGAGVNGATGVVVRLQVAVGAKVSKGSLIASVRFGEEPSTVYASALAPHDGVVKVLSVREGDAVSVLSVLGELEYCLHSVIVDGLCAMCGQAQQRAPPVAVSSAVAVTADEDMRHTVSLEGGFTVQVAPEEARTSSTRSTKRLFERQRLSLVLDLDHTLVHCTDDARAPQLAKGAANLSTFELGGKTLVLKMRPGLATFLREMHEMYDMYVYTAGTRAYAEKVCSLMDPTNQYFGGRIVARDDADTPAAGLEKTLTRIFPVDDSMVVIVDDRDVWSGSEKSGGRNLLTIEPYHFFHGLHEVNNQAWSPEDGGDDDAAASLNVADDSEMDSGLARVCGFLRRVRREFYFSPVKHTLDMQLSGQGGDVKRILRTMKESVLRHVTVAFDGATPNVQSLFERAQLCGAKVVTFVDASTTHLVAPGDTELARFARNKGVQVVHPRWLEISDHNWQRAPESSFLVYPMEQFAHNNNNNAKKRRAESASPRDEDA